MSTPKESTVSKVAKASKPTSEARRNLPKGTTAFELAVLAALLAPKRKPPQEFLVEAEKLLQAADKRLASRFPDAISAVLGFTRYSFDELLQPLSDQSPDKKKRCTLLGEITTTKGLLKAIRRAFHQIEADAIITARGFQDSQLRQLQDDLAFRRGSRKKRRGKAAAPPVKE